MADGRRYALNQQLDIEQILLEAQQRWLRPVEICEILRNYRKFHIAPEPPNKPPSVTGGSLFLFDRKVLRYFRKDGHSWRKKKDGKTVKEAHERLKAESIDVLHCYYAHGEENENFQRRTYWMLEEAFMHIVLVHYLEVKGGKASYSRTRDDNETASVGHMDSPLCSNSFTSQDQLPSQTTDAGSPNSAHASEYEDAQSDNYQARSRYHPFLGLQQYENGHLMDEHLLNSNIPVSSLINQYDDQIPQALTPETDFNSASKESLAKAFDGIGLDLGFSGSRSPLDLPPWDEVLEQNSMRFPSASIPTSFETQDASTGNISRQVTYTFGELIPHDVNIKQLDDVKAGLQVCDADADTFASSKVDVNYELSLEGNINSTIWKQSSVGLSNVEGEGLKKYDSFSNWMSKALAEVDDSNMKSTSQGYWNFMESERDDDSGMSNPEQDAFIVGPSVSQDQLFSIIDFSPNWAYSGVETKVLITGIFLKDNKDVENLKLSCMFGEVEVPAEILADGILRCHAPPHTSGRVPFYITCSNRLACSEVREFEYRVNHAECMETSDFSTCNTNEMHLHIRLGKLLSVGPVDYSAGSSDDPEKVQIRNKINLLLMEADDKWFNMLRLSNNKELSPDRVKDQLLQKLLKEKLHDWLIQKISEDGKGPNVLDKEGQGVIHLTAALGYDWAIKPIITSGVSINFRDARGWTALHWAASCGRERTVVSLVTLGAATGALTDPTPDFPSGRTPADLASSNGHKGIAGFLAESSLTSHLSVLTVKDTRGINLTDVSCIEGIDRLEEQSGIHLLDGNVEAGLSLKDSLCAVRNAALAAARIHQVFRVDSFQRKQIVEYGDGLCGISDEQALSLVSVKSCKPGQGDMPVHAAAIRIQNKYRGWKGRKEFLITRQRIVKIQAHVRGHQVRKRYKKIVFTVGIWEKAILRWRRKGSGLRGFRSGAEGSSMQIESAKEDDYDFLKEGRKQTEARLDKALSRVKSMVQYPEARDQYRRLLTVVTELQESNVMEENIQNEAAEAAVGDLMDELEEFCDDGSFAPSA